MAIRYSAGSDMGKVRERNEDNNTIIDCGNCVVLAVADGMGGMDFGDMASSIAVEYVTKEFSGRSTPSFKTEDISGFFVSLFNDINTGIIKKCIEKKSVTGMGTTLSMGMLQDGILYISHIGDSRIYVIRGGEAIQLTTDHSYVEELIASGRITREQAKNHPNRNIITRALGLDREIVVDTDVCDLLEGDRILLCTDGLTNAVEDEELVSIVSENDDPDEAVRLLIEMANDRGGRDNITVQLLYKEV